MEIWEHVFDKVKLENERMTLWNAICPYDTHFLPTLTTIEIVCQSNVSSLASLICRPQLPSLVWYMEHKTLPHHPPN